MMKKHTFKQYLKRSTDSCPHTYMLGLVFLILCIGPSHLRAGGIRVAAEQNIVFHISAGERLHDFMFAQLQGLEDASVSIDASGISSVTGKATLLRDYVFQDPGTYRIRFTRVHNHADAEPGHTCDHYALPEQISVEVNPHRIEYLTQTISFSKKLVGGQAADQITLRIQAKVTGTNVPTPTEVMSSGINTDIMGILNPEQAILSTGTHTLQYQLKGMGKSGTYIQFNFKDANGHDVPCGITTPL